MIVLVYYISDHFRKTANLEGEKNPSSEMTNTIRSRRELLQAGTAGETRGLHARCEVPGPTLVSSDAGARKGQRAPGGILFLLQTLAKPHGPSPHVLPLPRTSRITATLQFRRKEGGFMPLWKRKGKLGNQRRDAGGLWRAKGVPRTGGHAHLQHTTFGG